MAVRERTESERVIAARERYVPRGIATSSLVVARAEGARIWDVDGREYLDFAGGIACQNLGHGLPSAVKAIHDQVDRYLHQCFMVGLYEPYVEVCRRLGELSPCSGAEQKTLLVSSGAEAIENAVKIARAATGRRAVIVFDNAFHGRTLLTLAMTANVKYKRGIGPVAGDVFRAPAPYPYRGITSDDALAGVERLLQTEVEPESVACAVLEPVQGEGGFVVMPKDFPARLKELCERHGILYVDDEIQSGIGRTGPLWAIEHYDVRPDLMVSGKSLGGGLPLAAVTGGADVMDAVAPGGLGGTFGGNPVACGAALAVLAQAATPDFRARAEQIGRHLSGRLDALATCFDAIGEVRGLGPMQALELVDDPATKRPAGGLAAATVAAARERGLVLLTCGLHGNVIRLLVPLVVAEEDLSRGLDILEESLVSAGAGT
jgi:4-aminobutyrate aminotransferase